MFIPYQRLFCLERCYFAVMDGSKAVLNPWQPLVSCRLLEKEKHAVFALFWLAVCCLKMCIISLNMKTVETSCIEVCNLVQNDGNCKRPSQPDILSGSPLRAYQEVDLKGCGSFLGSLQSDLVLATREFILSCWARVTARVIANFQFTSQWYRHLLFTVDSSKSCTSPRYNLWYQTWRKLWCYSTIPMMNTKFPLVNKDLKETSI